MPIGYLGGSHPTGTSHCSLILFKGWSHCIDPHGHTKLGQGPGAEGESRAESVTSSFPLRGTGYHHPIQGQLDNWRLNSGKFKRQLRKGLILVQTLVTLALDDQGHQE